IAEKVAGALQYAHEQDVVHRDIKPANILMSRGEPLVADFGIALALSEAGGGRITETGLSLGTPHYMSPEQASGDQLLDKRSDVYALGCILYEMLTGEPPYGGPTAQSVLAKILTGDAQRITDLRKTVPLHVDAAVAKALEKLPADRFASAEAFVRALEDETFRHTPRQVAAREASKTTRLGSLRSGLPLAGALAGAVLLGAALALVLDPAEPAEPVFKTGVELPEGEELVEVPFGSPIALSPDGSTLVYAGHSDNQGWQLWIKRADGLRATPLPGSGNGLTPIFSPNGNEVAFIQETDLKVVGLGTGTVRTIDDDTGGLVDWTEDGQIYYIAAMSNRFFRIPAAGGEREVVAGLSPTGQATPVSTPPLYSFGDVLPGGRTGVWTVVPVTSNVAEASIAIVDLETGETRAIAQGSSPRYLQTGHLAWVSPEDALLVAPFDVDTRELTGAPIPVAERVRTDGQGGVHASFSERGDLVFRQGDSQARGMKIVWIDRTGEAVPVDPDWEVMPVGTGNWSGLALSPDGRRIVTTDGGTAGAQLWVKDLEADTPPYRITFEGSFHVRPRWMPDGDAVTFISNLGGPERPTEVWAKAADGSGSAWQVAASEVEIEEATVSPDGDWLVYRQGGTTADRDIYGQPMNGDSAARPIAATQADEKSPQVSPDGRWLAYASSETGQLEVFVRPFPDVTGGKWQISVGGGFSPLWSNDGSELFYLSTRGGLFMTSARLDLRESSLSVTGREALFPTGNQYIDQNYTAFDVDVDDQRFLMFSFGAASDARLIWVRSWLTEWTERAVGGQ
ncbi:MAG: protein kinase, partial [Longimicrobiales bacterium]|nr:protein kinase [Longimicrobiales bacterium]